MIRTHPNPNSPDEITTADDISPMYLVDMYAPDPILTPSIHFGDLILVAVAHFPYHHLTSSALLTGYLRFVQHSTSEFVLTPDTVLVLCSMSVPL